MTRTPHVPASPRTDRRRSAQPGRVGRRSGFAQRVGVGDLGVVDVADRQLRQRLPSCRQKPGDRTEDPGRRRRPTCATLLRRRIRWILMAHTRPGPIAEHLPDQHRHRGVGAGPISGGWLLQINGAHSSAHRSRRSDGARLELRQMAAVIDDRFDTGTAWRASSRWRGVRPGALPRRPVCESRHVAVEVNSTGRLVREMVELPRAPRLRIRVGDARAVTESLQAADSRRRRPRRLAGNRTRPI